MRIANNSKAGISRRDVASRLGCHPDTVTRLLPEGLGGAVLQWGGHGAEMFFDPAQVERFRGARACRATGRFCAPCYDVMYDLVAVAEHLAATRHGFGGCRLCHSTWRLVQPCGRVG